MNIGKDNKHPRYICDNCEKKFREWLNTKEIPTIEDVINIFPRWEDK